MSKKKGSNGGHKNPPRTMRSKDDHPAPKTPTAGAAFPLEPVKTEARGATA